MFHQPHPTVFGPTFFVIVADNILVVWVRVLGEITLDELSCLVGGKFEQNIQMIHIPEINSNRMFSLKLNTLKQHKLILIKSRPSNLIRPIQPNNQQINNQPIELIDK